MLTGGVRPGQLIVVGARPGMGKSSLMVQLAVRNRTHLVSLEMTRTEIMNRIISLYGKVPYRIAHDEIADAALRDRWIVAAHAAGLLPITISDRAGQTTTQIEAEVEQRIVSDGIQMVIIDHLDWIGDKIKTESPEVRTAALVNRCKAMAKACRIPVILLAQLNRNVEHRPGFFPYLSDFRNSGAVEQDADVAILLYRRSYYTSRGMLAADVTEDLLPGTNMEKAEIIVAKNRNGAIGTLNVGWNPSTMSFREERRAA
jgi:replicative DNA helicase